MEILITTTAKVRHSLFLVWQIAGFFPCFNPGAPPPPFTSEYRSLSWFSPLKIYLPASLLQVLFVFFGVAVPIGVSKWRIPCHCRSQQNLLVPRTGCQMLPPLTCQCSTFCSSCPLGWKEGKQGVQQRRKHGSHPSPFSKPESWRSSSSGGEHVDGGGGRHPLSMCPLELTASGWAAHAPVHAGLGLLEPQWCLFQDGSGALLYNATNREQCGRCCTVHRSAVFSSSMKNEWGSIR